MGKPAAKKGDKIKANDTHILLVPAPPAPPVPTPFSHKFEGILNDKLSKNVKIMGKAAAVVGSIAENTPPHVPQGFPFQKPPANKGKILKGSKTVKINGKAAARDGDMTETCNDPSDMPVGEVSAKGTVKIGD